MNNGSRYAVGIDLGTTTVKCVVASINGDGNPKIIGVGSAENSGMKKGVVSHTEAPFAAIDKALADAEAMAGISINKAAFSINGSHILSTKTDGMVAISGDGVVSYDDIARIEDVASVGRLPSNREKLSFIPYSYSLDGQGDISDPLDMAGTRLEVEANVVSALAPHINNISILAEKANLAVSGYIPSVMAAAKAVLSEKQKENGVAVVDLGAATTGVAVYEDGNLQYMRVIPLGGINITNDLAIGLKITPEIAEEIKLKHSLAGQRSEHRDIMVKNGREHYSFNTAEIDEIIDARLEEIFDEIREELKKAGRDAQLPSGVVLVGGGANMRKIDEYAKAKLKLASQIGQIKVESPVTDAPNSPEYATAVGLMISDISNEVIEESHHKRDENRGGFLAKLFKRN